MKFRILWVLWVVMLIAGCATTEAPLDPKIYYKHDMKLTVNGRNFLGVAVVPRADTYKIEITSFEDMDLLQITSCAEDFDIMSAIKNDGLGGWLRPKRTFTFTYQPNTVEKQRGCTLKMQGLNKTSGRHSWAFIQFENPDFKLSAGVACNNDPDYLSDGTTICQTLQRLIMRIWFANPVVTSSKVLARCKLPDDATKDGGLHFQFQVPSRECAYEFMEAKPPYRRHELTTVGYEDVPIRTDN